MKELSAKQQRFVDEYLLDLNATAAYKRAGYEATGRSAENNASRLLGHAGVSMQIAAALKERSVRTQIDADTVLKNIARLAQSAERASDYGAALRGNELLGRHLKLFTDKIDLSGAVTVNITRFGPEKEST